MTLRPEPGKIAACVLAACALGACGGGDGTVVFVTVGARATVRPVEKLHVDVANAGSTRSQEFVLGGGGFPQTFTVTPDGRAGDLVVTVTGVGEGELPVGRGSVTGAIAQGGRVDLAVTLEPDDFVVNQMIAESQRLSFRSQLTGRQLAVAPDGTFMFVWENSCPLSRCDILARRFAADTRPATNGTTSTDDDFIVNQKTEFTTTPVIAAGAAGYLVAWVFSDMDPNDHIEASALGADGAHKAFFDTTLSSGTTDRSPVAIARGDGTYVMVWEKDRMSPMTGMEVRAQRLTADGALVGVAFVVAQSTTTSQGLPHAAPLGNGGFVVVWEDTDAMLVTNIHARAYDASGNPITMNDIRVTSYPAGGARMPHVAATPTGGFVVGWQVSSGMTEDLRLRRFEPSGAAIAPESVVTGDARDWEAAPSLAVRGDGAIGAAWQDCDARGDGMGCAIRFRMFHPNGQPSGDDVVVNTTLAGDQTTPSIAALPGGEQPDGPFLLGWTDDSAAQPDDQPGAIRARVIYPDLARRDGVVGAHCGAVGDAPCATGLACANAPQGGALCLTECTEPEGTACAAGGTCTGGVCVFPAR